MYNTSFGITLVTVLMVCCY